MISRRTLLSAAAVILAGTTACSAARRPDLTVYKTASCGCCGGWVDAMTRAGYAPKVIVVEDLTALGTQHGVPFELSSCHLATVAGYVTVGHVPPADVDRLIREKPKALGLTVPGMPMGSPGMEMPDGAQEAYDTLLLLPGGGTRVFAHHA
jgi:hypothetical protein